jgi:hypothetical protein
MTSDEKTSISSLLKYINSDLYTIGNISESITLTVPRRKEEEMVDNYISPNQWEVIIKYLPLEFYEMLNSYNSNGKLFRYEDFDEKKYSYHPKRYAYDKYGLTNMWRPIMILNKCPSILDFKFERIRYYDMTELTKLMSVLISRAQHSE